MDNWQTYYHRPGSSHEHDRDRPHRDDHNNNNTQSSSEQPPERPQRPNDALSDDDDEPNRPGRPNNNPNRPIRPGLNDDNRRPSRRPDSHDNIGPSHNNGHDNTHNSNIVNVHLSSSEHGTLIDIDPEDHEHSHPSRPSQPLEGSVLQTLIENTKCNSFIPTRAGKSCQLYTSCIFGHFKIHSCPDDKVFDPFLRICSSDWSSCSYIPGCKQVGQRFRVPNDSNAFLECVPKKFALFTNPFRVVKRKCADGERFDSHANACAEKRSQSSSFNSIFFSKRY